MSQSANADNIMNRGITRIHAVPSQPVTDGRNNGEAEGISQLDRNNTPSHFVIDR